MAIVKLVCQGCGANLDAIEPNVGQGLGQGPGLGQSHIITCGYCGTNNQIQTKQTFQPTPPPPPQYAAPPQFAQQPNIPKHTSSGGGAGTVVAIMALIPILIAAGVAFFVFRAGVTTFEQLSGVLSKRNFLWNSGTALIADVDGDGTDDAIGVTQELGEQKLLLTAISGKSYATLWEVELGRLSDLPDRSVYVEPGAQLAVVAMGPALHAYDLSNGTPRWVATLPDKIENVAIDGDHFWISTIDGAAHSVALVSGQVAPTSAPSPTAKPLRDDDGYDLIPDLAQLDLAYDQFEGLRVAQAFCPIENLPLITGRRWDEDSKRCSHPHGLAFVTRDKGTAVPYFIGYDHDTKAERWRMQLTRAGSLETVDTGFGQPRAEFFGDDAIVSLVPTADNNTRIRRIRLNSGIILWETTLVRKSTEHVNGIAVGQNRVFVIYGNSLRVLSLDDGSELASLGGF
jgi:hypothetical protein